MELVNALRHRDNGKDGLLKKKDEIFPECATRSVVEVIPKRSLGTRKIFFGRQRRLRKKRFMLLDVKSLVNALRHRDNGKDGLLKKKDEIFPES
jgi:hypothetical protein